MLSLARSHLIRTRGCSMSVAATLVSNRFFSLMLRRVLEPVLSASVLVFVEPAQKKNAVRLHFTPGGNTTRATTRIQTCNILCVWVVCGVYFTTSDTRYNSRLKITHIHAASTNSQRERVRKMPESIYGLVPREPAVPVKPPMYKSKHDPRCLLAGSTFGETVRGFCGLCALARILYILP